MLVEYCCCTGVVSFKAGTVYYVSRDLGTGAPVSPGPTNWGNSDGTNSTKSRATNGSSIQGGGNVNSKD